MAWIAVVGLATLPTAVAQSPGGPPNPREAPGSSEAHRVPDEQPADAGSLPGGLAGDESRPEESEGSEEPVPEPPAEVDEAMADPAVQADQAARLQDIEDELYELRDEVDLLREDLAFAEQQLEHERTELQLSGYIDFGFFYVGGDGSGIRTDIGNRYFPEYAGLNPGGSWIFMGDPLSTAINARGEPADTGESRAVAFDSVDSRGGPSFILNTMSLSLFAGLTDQLQANGQVYFVPRGRDISNPDGLFLGDFVEIPLAYLEYRIAEEAFDLSLFAGKFDSVLGVEYRSQDAPTRIEVTPSLLCRYTCGRPLGLKARAGFFEGRPLVLNVSVTNGSHFSEGFPFYDEVDHNAMKTIAGRLSYELPLAEGVEIGASGAIGAQDLQFENDTLQWHYGFDLLIDWTDLVLAGEFIMGEAEGRTSEGSLARCDGGSLGAACLEYVAAYGRVGYRFTNWFLPYVRVDFRNALHTSGGSFVYESELIRATGGVRLELDRHFLVKVEYTHNRELGKIPQFDNDVLTSSFLGVF